VEKDI